MYCRCEEAAEVPWHCEMPSEMLLPCGAQQCVGINESGVGRACEQSGGLVCEGDRLRQGFVIRIAAFGKHVLMARPHEKKLGLARRALKVINCQSIFCVCAGLKQIAGLRGSKHLGLALDLQVR